MSDRSKIEWCDATWSPVTGCSPVSAGCDNCYAERMSRRFYRGWNPRGHFKVRFHHDRLDQPLRWRKPKRVFVCSMGDLFHEDVSVDRIGTVFDYMAMADHHTFMVLTKRAGRMLDILSTWDRFPDRQPRRTQFDNIWLGVTTENQQTADERIPILFQTPAAKRFVSVEPMLGPVDLESLGPDGSPNAGWNVLTGRQPCCHEHPEVDKWRERLDWVICGGESGPGARPMHPDWPRSLRDQCQAAGVPFFFKQNGEWASVSEVAGPGAHYHFPDGATVRRVGKKAAGCLLDGREWKEFPGVTP